MQSLYICPDTDFYSVMPLGIKSEFACKTEANETSSQTTVERSFIQ